MRKQKKKLRRDVRAKDLVTKKPKRVKPLKFLLNVMNDPKMDSQERIKAALAALPYCHAQKTRKVGKEAKEPRPVGRPTKPEEEKVKKLGKKETKQVEATSAASHGRFRPLSPPQASRVNGASH